MRERCLFILFSVTILLHVYVGQIYVAFFNLNEDKTVISTEMSYLAKVLPGRDFSSCKCKEVWSGKDIVIVEGKLSMVVAKHGCALFVMNCS